MEAARILFTLDLNSTKPKICCATVGQGWRQDILFILYLCCTVLRDKHVQTIMTGISLQPSFSSVSSDVKATVANMVVHWSPVFTLVKVFSLRKMPIKVDWKQKYGRFLYLQLKLELQPVFTMSQYQHSQILFLKCRCCLCLPGARSPATASVWYISDEHEDWGELPEGGGEMGWDKSREGNDVERRAFAVMRSVRFACRNVQF